MKESFKKYKSKIVTKQISFYLKDQDILALANSINFQKFVKDALKKELGGGDNDK